MESLNTSYITEQNKISGSGAWIWLLQVHYTSSQSIRFANNNEAILWNGSSYQPMSFIIDDISMSTSGKFPEYRLQIGDAYTGSDLRVQVRAGNGLVGRTVRIMVVHSDHLSLTTPAIDELAEILSCDVTAEAIIFTIGIPSLLSRRFPRDRYVPGFCRHKFAGALCQYAQPAHSRPSYRVSLHAGENYNTIQCANGRLISDVFLYAPGVGRIVNGVWQRVLTKDTGFTISGSLYNDGFFLANSYYHVEQLYVRVFTEAEGGRPFVEEPVGRLVTIQLGYNQCDHTLEACALRNNTRNYGGSPGIRGGMYG